MNRSVPTRLLRSQSRFRNAFVVLLLLTGALSVLAPGLVQAQTTLRFQNGTARWDAPLTAGVRMDIANVNGEVRARPSGSDRASVVARRSGEDAEDVQVELVRKNGGGVAVCVRYPHSEGTCGDESPGGTGDTDAKVAFEVRVPKGVRFSGRTVNGRIEARRMPAETKAQTVSGAVDVSGSGNVTAQTVNGDVQVEAGGWAKAETVNGEIDVTMGRADWNGTLELQTVSGDIRVALPAGASAKVRAESETGDIDIGDLPLSIDAGFVGSEASGTLGQGGRRLRIQTTSGSVVLSISN